MQAKAEAWDLTRAGLAELMDIAHKQFGGDGNAEAVVLRGRGYIVTDVDKINDQRIINALRNLCPECGAAPGDHCVAIKVAERKVGKGSFCHGGREL
jgi:fructose-1,6-bisphosphatase/inositol monophosphatase family enzyme